MPDAHYIIILTTSPSPEEARTLASGLVTNKLAACVQCSPITSWYTWDNAVTMDNEIRLVIKTTHALYHDVEEYIQANHSYDVPEIVAIPLLKGSASYLDWIASVTLSGTPTIPQQSE